MSSQGHAGRESRAQARRGPGCGMLCAGIILRAVIFLARAVEPCRSAVEACNRHDRGESWPGGAVPARLTAAQTGRHDCDRARSAAERGRTARVLDMGHGDSIALADANCATAYHLGRRRSGSTADLTVRWRAILSVMPLDGFVDTPVQRMETDARPKDQNEAHRRVRHLHGRGGWPGPGRWFDRSGLSASRGGRRACVAVFATLEMRPYANLILTRDVIGEDGAVVRPGRTNTAAEGSCGPGGASAQGPRWRASARRQGWAGRHSGGGHNAAMSIASPPSRRARM